MVGARRGSVAGSCSTDRPECASRSAAVVARAAESVGRPSSTWTGSSTDRRPSGPSGWLSSSSSGRLRRLAAGRRPAAWRSPGKSIGYGCWTFSLCGGGSSVEDGGRKRRLVSLLNLLGRSIVRTICGHHWSVGVFSKWWNAASEDWLAQPSVD